MRKGANHESERTETGGLNAFLDQGSTFEGKLTFKGTVRLDGTFKGEILSDDVLVVGETGRIEGTVQVGEAIVSGRLTGALVAQRRLHLRPSAVVEGEVTTAALVVDEGATLDGRVRMRERGETEALGEMVARTLGHGGEED